MVVLRNFKINEIQNKYIDTRNTKNEKKKITRLTDEKLGTIIRNSNTNRNYFIVDISKDLEEKVPEENWDDKETEIFM